MDIQLHHKVICHSRWMVGITKCLINLICTLKVWELHLTCECPQHRSLSSKMTSIMVNKCFSMDKILTRAFLTHQVNRDHLRAMEMEGKTTKTMEIINKCDECQADKSPNQLNFYMSKCLYHKALYQSKFAFYARYYFISFQKLLNCFY